MKITVESVALGILALVVAFAVLAFTYGIVGTVASLRNEKHCLEAGYPRTETAWDFQGYCMNLEGSVTVSVDKLP